MRRRTATPSTAAEAQPTPGMLDGVLQHEHRAALAAVVQQLIEEQAGLTCPGCGRPVKDEADHWMPDGHLAPGFWLCDIPPAAAESVMRHARRERVWPYAVAGAITGAALMGGVLWLLP